MKCRPCRTFVYIILLPYVENKVLSLRRFYRKVAQGRHFYNSIAN
jgi:hypothetical protein